MTSKFGYQVHSKMTYQRGWSAGEQNYFWQHLERLQPAAMLFLDDDASAAECKRRLPNCAVVVRHWANNEGRLHLERTPQEVFQQYRNIPGDLIVNIGNEPSGYDDKSTSWDELNVLAKWYAELMNLFGYNHQSVCVPNFGEGHPDENHLSALEPLWDAFDKWHTEHVFGVHEYGTHRGMMFNESGKYDVYPWRVGRFEALVRPYLEAHGHKVPNIILTECGIDDAHDGTGKRGWKDAGDEAWYIGQLKAAYDAIYHKPHYVGVCLFCYGNSGKQGDPQDWRTFDVSEAKTLHAALEALAKPVAPTEPPPPAKPVVTVPPNMGLPVNGRRPPGYATTIRHMPEGERVGSIPPEATYTYYPATAVLAHHQTERWVFVEYGKIQGWAFMDALGLDNPDPPTPPPDDTATRAKLEQLAVQIEQLSIKIDNMFAAINAAFETFTKRARGE